MRLKEAKVEVSETIIFGYIIGRIKLILYRTFASDNYSHLRQSVLKFYINICSHDMSGMNKKGLPDVTCKGIDFLLLKNTVFEILIILYSP